MAQWEIVDSETQDHRRHLRWHGATWRWRILWKDPSKVDRSAAYAGRYVAKNIVAAGLADRCEVQVSYAIGVAEPTSISIDTFGTSTISEDSIVTLIREHFDLRPKGLINMLDLKRPIYQATASYGHFGRELAAFTWERTDKADALRQAATKPLISSNEESPMTTAVDLTQFSDYKVADISLADWGRRSLRLQKPRCLP